MEFYSSYGYAESIIVQMIGFSNQANKFKMQFFIGAIRDEVRNCSANLVLKIETRFVNQREIG